MKTTTTRSAIYKGQVRHRRFTPVEHAFDYSMAQLCLDLDEVDELLPKLSPWISQKRPTPLRFDAGDYLSSHVDETASTLSGAAALAESVRALVAEQSGQRPSGPVHLLAHVRTFGYVFNPVSFYYCYESDGQTLAAIVAEITNTPWKERHSYVLCPRDGEAKGEGTWHEFDKQFHVSPFMPMEQRYRWHFTAPGEHLFVRMENYGQGDDTSDASRRRFDATLRLEREPLTRKGLGKLLVRYPLMTLHVVAAIHWQAFHLWRKRVPFFSHPAKQAPPDALAGVGGSGPRSKT